MRVLRFGTTRRLVATIEINRTIGHPIQYSFWYIFVSLLRSDFLFKYILIGRLNWRKNKFDSRLTIFSRFCCRSAHSLCSSLALTCGRNPIDR